MKETRLRPLRDQVRFAGMLDPILAALTLGCGWLLPLLHVGLSRHSGPWRPPVGAGCPLGPRPGWLVMILLTGPIGWLLYLRSRRRLRGSR